MLHKFIVLLLLLSSLVMFGCSSEKPARSELSLTQEQTISDENRNLEKIQYQMSENGSLTIRGVGTTNCDDLMVSLMSSGFDAEDVTKIIICDGITGIGEYCFEQYFNVSVVTMANSVKIIEEDAFTGCERLEEMNLSDDLVRIEKEAFSYCCSLRKLILPKSLEYYSEDAIVGCNSLAEIENKSSHTWQLCKKGLAGNWYSEGRLTKKILPGRTAVIQSISYPIVYDLNGGVAKEKLPAEYESRKACKIHKSVTRKGYSFVNWVIEGEATDTIKSGNVGKRNVKAIWIKFNLENKPGRMVRAFWKLDTCGYDYHCVLRYSQKENMKSSEFVHLSNDSTETVLKNLKRGKNCYVEYAVIEDLDDWDELDDLPWQGKQSIMVW